MSEPAPPSIDFVRRIVIEHNDSGRFGGRVQIQSAVGWALISEGEPVSILEPDGVPPLSDVGRVVRVFGTLNGAGDLCGGMNRCWEMTTGAGWPITFRSASEFLETGDCVTYVGPLRSFGDRVQLDTVNFDWSFRR